MKNQKLLIAVIIIMAANFLWQLYNVAIAVYSGYFDPFFLFRYIPTLIGVIAIILFVASKFRKSGLLRFYMGTILFAYPFTVGLYISFFTRTNGFIEQAITLNAMQYVWMAIGFVFTAANAVGLWILSRTRVAKVTYNFIGRETFPEFTPASMGKRFLNRVADSFVYIYIALIYINDGLFGEALRDEASFGIYTLFELPFLVAYYLLFEAVFQSTPGKCLTNTIVVNDSGERPSFTQILGRTFSRLIPFDAFTFFGNSARGWHDSLPNTYVVEAAGINEQHEQEFILDAERDATVNLKV